MSDDEPVAPGAAEGPAPQPLADRFDGMIRFLQVALGLAFALGAASLIVPGELERPLAKVMVATLVATPIVRVIWLQVRWFRRRDVRFVLAGVALLAVITAAFVVALTRH